MKQTKKNIINRIGIFIFLCMFHGFEAFNGNKRLKRGTAEPRYFAYRSPRRGVISIFCLLGMLFVFTSMDILSQKVVIKKRPPLELRYIANEGVMLSSGKQKVLVDALFSKPHPNYNAPAKEILKKILAGQPPFDNVTLVLVTHNHGDHFEAPLAAKFLANQPGAFLAAPADAVAALKESAKDWQKIQKRVVSLDLKAGETTGINIKGISVNVFCTLHSGDRETPTNLMYLVDLQGWRIFHEGDSDGHLETFKKFKLGKESIDLALVHFWFPLDADGSRIIQEVLRPEHTGLIHLPKRLESDAPNKINMVRKHYKDIFLLLPGTAPKIYR